MDLFLQAGLVIFVCINLLWLLSVFLKNVSIIDIFWGTGFLIVNAVFATGVEELHPRNILLLVLVSAWSLRLSLHLAYRNIGKGEDFRYKEFRRKYGPKNYWWISYFQVFLLQGILIMLVSLPLLGAHTGNADNSLNLIDFLGILIWMLGFGFEAGGDLQLARFKKNPSNKGKVLRKGFWKYTRHPNYFGDAMVWWAYALFSVAAGNYWHISGALLMTYLLVKISGVSMLEESMQDTKPGYKEYMQNTPSFFPWFPKKQ